MSNEEDYIPIEELKGKLLGLDFQGAIDTLSLNKRLHEKVEDLKKTVDDIKEETKTLKGQVDNIENNAKKVEERIKSSTNFIMWVAVAIIVAFFLAMIPIAYDYFNNNEERYEKFINKVEEIGTAVYTKDELSQELGNLESNTDILDCIKAKGYFSIKCFED